MSVVLTEAQQLANEAGLEYLTCRMYIPDAPNNAMQWVERKLQGRRETSQTLETCLQLVRANSGTSLSGASGTTS